MWEILSSIFKDVIENEKPQRRRNSGVFAESRISRFYLNIKMLGVTINILSITENTTMCCYKIYREIRYWHCFGQASSYRLYKNLILYNVCPKIRRYIKCD